MCLMKKGHKDPRYVNIPFLYVDIFTYLYPLFILF